MHSGIGDDEVCATHSISDVWLILWCNLSERSQVSALHIDGLAPVHIFCIFRIIKIGHLTLFCPEISDTTIGPTMTSGSFSPTIRPKASLISITVPLRKRRHLDLLWASQRPDLCGTGWSRGVRLHRHLKRPHQLPQFAIIHKHRFRSVPSISRYIVVVLRLRRPSERKPKRR